MSYRCRNIQINTLTKGIPLQYIKYRICILCVLDRAASSWYLNKGWPTRWHLLYCLLLNMFQTLICPSSGAFDYLLRCVGWLEALLVLCSGIVCWWCGIRGWTTMVQPTLGYHITNKQSRYITPATPQVSLHNATSSRKLLKMDILTSETCWAVDNKASVI